MQDDEGNIVPVTIKPFDGHTGSGDSTNYEIIWGDGYNNKDWVYYGGYFYYTDKLPPDTPTSELIESVTSRNDEYHFRLDVSAQLIQAEPEQAIIDAWGVVITEDGVQPAPQNP